MLRDLRIRNFALIDELELAFEPGLNVITGETGAGKTILMAALGLTVGGKAAADVIRTGEEEAFVEAVFAIDGTPASRRLTESGFSADGSELLIRRALSRSGRNRVHLNGTLATLGVLETVGDGLIRVYGQHEHHTLREAETHLGLLDAFAGHGELLEEMGRRYQAWHVLAERLRRLTEGKEAARAQAELLRFHVNEIAEANLHAGEEEQLQQERRVLASAERLAEAAAFGEEALYSGEAAAAGAVKKVAQRLAELVAVDPRLEEIAKLLDEASSVVEEAGWRLREYAGKVTFDPERLDAAENRLARIVRLKRKYGDSVGEILEYREKAQRELADLDLGDEGIAQLERDGEAAEREARKAAAALSKSRRMAAKKLEQRLVDELADLGMKSARFQIAFEVGEEPAPLTAAGTDRVEFYFSANPGEDPRPLARVASGGELSRIMLALKSAAVEDAEAPTVIFDEVDAGIGGATAEVVGRKLAALAASRQVICITHLAQIAAFADHHFAVAKETVKGRTRSSARKLAATERRDEIARMIGGLTVTPEARRHAEQLLAGAKRR